MPHIEICSDLLQKVVIVEEGHSPSIIEREVLKRLVTITGISKLQCDVVASDSDGYRDAANMAYELYQVELKAPTGVTLNHFWVRWYE